MTIREIRGLSQLPVASAAGSQAAAEHRHLADRRARPTPMFCRHTFFKGKRRTVRRAYDREGSFVDVHGPRILALAVAVIALNVLDAWFTLYFLSYGGTELNPAVQWVLDSAAHPWPFVLLKTLGIGTASAFLVVTKNFKPARIGIWIVFAGYAVLLLWHFYVLHLLNDLSGVR